MCPAATLSNESTTNRELFLQGDGSHLTTHILLTTHHNDHFRKKHIHWLLAELIFLRQLMKKIKASKSAYTFT